MPGYKRLFYGYGIPVYNPKIAVYFFVGTRNQQDNNLYNLAVGDILLCLMIEVSRIITFWIADGKQMALAKIPLVSIFPINHPADVVVEFPFPNQEGTKDDT